ncbi:MAG: signal peptidase I [Sedimentisphaerales bacterium]|jgi:signal peptidase I
MAVGKKEKSMDAAHRTKNRVGEIANTLEWLITAFALAFVFRAFVMEAFRIPTGSMADTLLGAHYRLRCTQCGYQYCYGISGFRMPPSTAKRFSRHEYSRCPSCGYFQATPDEPEESSANGDRILVLKCLYQFVEPKQWDVVVFKNPLDPSENYIKRLVGKPGETVEIIDGDVYINGQISRKPAKVQEELWMPVCDNDYQPARQEEPAFNGHPWHQPFRNVENSKWITEEESPTVFRLAGAADKKNWLVYDTSLGNDFRATYAYDEIMDYRYMPYCSDLMVRFWVSSSEPAGLAGATLGKYGISYTGQVDFAGQMTITRVSDGKEQTLATKTIGSPAIDKPTMLRFANVDHELILEFGGEKLIYDLGRGPDDAGVRKTGIEPEARIVGAGKLEISHLALFRDIHYTANSPNSSDPGRATEGKPLKLAADQFFMLGDNSPRSEDGRWWSSPGKGNDGKTYSKGIVPREYLIGKAIFVYWPAGFKPFPKFPLALIPNVGELRFIYGGSDNVE